MLLAEGIYWFSTIFLTKIVGALIYFLLGPVKTIQGIKIRFGFLLENSTKLHRQIYQKVAFNLEGVATIMENTVQNNGMQYMNVFKSLQIRSQMDSYLDSKVH